MASPSCFGNPRSESGEPEKINLKRPILAVAPLDSMPYIGPPMPGFACSKLFENPRSESGAPEKINLKRPILAVAPLNSMPYIGPPMPNSYTASLPAKDSVNVERVGPAIIFLSSFTTREDWDNLMASNKLGVALTGSAAMGKIGSIIGLMDIGECEDSYLFRVSLPGVSRDESEFSCDIEPDGKVLIKGVTTTGEQIVCKNSQIFHMLTRNLCPPGHFSISFQLPGPVDQQQFSGSFGTDGILEGIVKKR
ncbi:alpha-crystallin domain-containing protein 22.3 isoform X1 [Morus notabilis]|uniref:alpha-crystallin domain-containing protein 22.3 isoform X1 n=1 Tax=Morus notabilis TaxID=981085 RepID=UPI000CED5170|nr:alpha-crystallin domain-containing protein 22.3 isoform X1 [Morus notabilis]